MTMAIDKKQRLVPGSMYIPPTPALVSPSGSLSISRSPRAGGSSALVSAATTRALTPNKPLGDLLRAVDPRSCFQPAVEELLLDMASDFVRDVVSFSSRLAKHRRSTELEASDLRFCLDKNYGISTPTTASASTVAPSLGARPAKNSLHMHRMALKRKTLQRSNAKLKKAAAAAVKATSAAKKTVQRKSSIAGAPDAK